jgi:hypothetical protein
MGEPNTCRDPEKGSLLTAYEMGLLDEREQAAFEAHLTDCPSCLEQLYAMAPSMVAIRANPEAFTALEGSRATEVWAPGFSFVAWLRDTLASLVRPRILVPAGVAALVAMVMIVQLRLDSPGAFQQLAIVEPVPYVQIDTRHVNTPEATLRYDQGMAQYAGGRYREAVVALTEAVHLGEVDPAWGVRDQARFYLGLSLLLQGEAALAAEHLTQATRASILPVAERARWYLAQAYLLQEDPEAALISLQALADSGVAYRDQASHQLEELQRIMAE